MQEVNAKIQLAIHADSGSDFNVLSINHTFLRLYLMNNLPKNSRLF
jgi:hypothetical protein